MPAEVPILRSIGWEVFVPKIIPEHDPNYPSAITTYDYDATLTLSTSALLALNRHDFYKHRWSPTVEDIIDRHFDAIISTFSIYTTPLSEAARKFRGQIIARVFGREHPRTYAELAAASRNKDLLPELGAVGNRFVFGQAYGNLADIEPEELRSRRHTITVPLPAKFYNHQNTWRGNGSRAVFTCPWIRPGFHYGNIYDGIKKKFGDLPHLIFGRQYAPFDDPAVLPYLTDTELLDLYAATPVFVYPHTEPRHVHYSPLEAMVVGTPTLYLRGALIDTLTGCADLPGACETIEEMHAKAQRLLSGDRILADAIRATQGQVLETLSPELARRQWEAVLADAPLLATPAAS
jgi:hypothetical protein